MIITSVFGGVSTGADASRGSNRTRIAHAKELLGATYKRSVVRNGEKVADMTDFLESISAEWLPKKYSKRARTLATAVIRESDKHGFDPVFIMAVIQNESMFNPEMRGMHTEIGLMQIKPTTARWVSEKTGVKYVGEKSLLDPVQNIRIGTAFMAMLRDQFDSHSPLYISAYNMGARRVRQIVADDRTPTIYVEAVMKRYVAIYSAFEAEDADDVDSLTLSALTRVREITRAVASN